MWQLHHLFVVGLGVVTVSLLEMVSLSVHFNVPVLQDSLLKIKFRLDMNELVGIVLNLSCLNLKITASDVMHTFVS